MSTEIVSVNANGWARAKHPPVDTGMIKIVTVMMSKEVMEKMIGKGITNIYRFVAKSPTSDLLMQIHEFGGKLHETLLNVVICPSVGEVKEVEVCGYICHILKLTEEKSLILFIFSSARSHQTGNMAQLFIAQICIRPNHGKYN